MRDQVAGQSGRRDERRPDLDGLAVIGARQEPGADAGHRAGRQFADDGADEARGDRRPSGEVNRNGTEAGTRSFQKVCARLAL